ncbi:peptide-N4-(N-acetyl-beta-glucosaminyl) asparagine amidase [Martiniozyma asiatica (nom. inval.)]|nr:peptide-N4-(N-acetyl-beta-glucosaminyl) asparagine amidase [Martiniozyma asiatica]
MQLNEFVRKAATATYDSQRRFILEELNKHALLKKNGGLEAFQNNKFARQLAGFSNIMDRYFDTEIQSKAIEIILASPVYQRVEVEESKGDKNFDYKDQLVKELLKWFKEEFFTWVNKPNCKQCGNTNQDQIFSLNSCAPYTAEHQYGRASIIERYQCSNCNTHYEFPRYNNPKILLRTREGRCGEWNNCFILLLITLGLDARYIWNAEDHVWCEYFSENLGRWIHLDSCENSFDNPMLYNEGWGKKMSYTFAIHQYYMIDISEKYLSSKPEHQDKRLPMAKMARDDLKLWLNFFSFSKLKTLVDESDFLLVTSHLIRDFKSNVLSASLNSKPRVSGSDEWTKFRGENGA